MKIVSLFPLLICTLLGGLCLYSTLDMQNKITELRIKIPHLAKEVCRIEEENTRFLYEIEAFESPENLMRLAKESCFTYLKYPASQEVLTLKQETVRETLKGGKETSLSRSLSVTFAYGARP